MLKRSSQKQNALVHPQPSRAKNRMLVLEPRYVFDAALAETLDHHGDSTDTDDIHVAKHDFDAQAFQNAVQGLAKSAAGPDSSDARSSPENLSKFIAEHNSSASKKEFAFVDSGLDDLDTLLSDIPSNVTIILVDPSSDGVAQMVSALRGTTDVTAIHIISHGSKGSIELGSSSINQDSMETVYRAALASLQANLADDADILVYGCNFGAGEAGVGAAGFLAQLTGADVAASTNVTGGVSGADWNLEYSTGAIEEQTIAAHDWRHELLDIVADDGNATAYKNTDLNGDLSSQVSAVNPTVPVTFTAQTIATAHGSVTIYADGTYVYTPVNGYLGTDTFIFEVSAIDPVDNVTQHATAVQTITISPNPGYVINAVDETNSVGYDRAFNGTVADNVTPSTLGGPITTYTVTVQPTHGTLTFNPASGTYTYTPNTGYSGPDSFSFSANDADPKSDAATAVVHFNVSPPPLIASPYDTYGVNDAPVTVTPAVYEADPFATLIYNVGTSPDGTLVSNGDGTFTFTPNPGFTGDTSVTYTVTDSNGYVSTNTITFHYSATGIPPLTANPDTYTIRQGDTVSQWLSYFETNKSGVAPTYSIVITSPPLHGTITNFDPATGSYNYIADPGYLGPDSFTFLVTDQDGQTASSVENINIVPPDMTVDSAVKFAPIGAAVSGNLGGETHESAGNTTEVFYIGTTKLTNGATIPTANGVVTIIDAAAGTYSWQPNAGFSGVEVINWSVRNYWGAGPNDYYETEVSTDTIVSPNRIYAGKHGHVIPFDTPKSGTVTAFSGTPNGAAAYTPTFPAAHGTATVDAAGNYTYTPNTGFQGLDKFGYKISNGLGNTATGYVTIYTAGPLVPGNVIPVSSDIPPRTNLDSDAGVNVDISGFFTDADADAMTFVADGLPPGLTMDAAGNITGTIDKSASQGGSFADGKYDVTIFADDGRGGVTQQTFTWTVTNPAPDAVDASTTTPYNTPKVVNLLANDTDPDGDALTVTSATVPAAQGTVAFNGTDWVYTPAVGFSGTATITYTISDGEGGTDTAVHTVTVANAPPDAVNDSTTTPYNTPVTVNLLANDTDPNGDTLTVTSATVPAAQGTVAFDGTDWVFTPVTGFSGTATITYSISDGKGGTDTATHTITVANAPPDAVNDSTTTPYNTPVTVNLLSNDTDPNGDTLTVTSATVPAAQGAVAFNGTDWVFTPATGFSGTATVTYSISDGKGGTDTATHTITVANAPPDAVNDSTTTPYNTPVTVNLLANDTDPNGDTLTVTSATVPAAQGTVAFNGTDWVFTPATGFSGTATVTYSISDGKGGTDTATHTITVANAPPDAVNDSTNTPFNTPVTVNLLANDTDPNGDALTVTSATVPAAQGTVAFNGTDWVFTPATGFVGTATITYSISDGKGGTDTASHAVQVANAAPDAVDGTSNGYFNTPTTVNLLANDTDPNGDPLTVTSATVPTAQGTVAFNGTSWVFTPAPGFLGTATITYSISDGKGGTDTAVHTVVVTRPPIAAVNDTYTTPFNTALNGNAAAGDTFALGSTFQVTTPPASGTVTMNPNGTYVFRPATNFTGTVTFTYTITDPSGQTATARETITVAPPQLTAINHTHEITYNKPFTTTAATGDKYPTGSVFTVVKSPAVGKVTMKADGTYTYTPPKGFTGKTSFTYQIKDPTGKIVTATEYISIKPRSVVEACLTTFGNLTGVIKKK